jgi:phosphorylcholine metabolism protein LicD
MAQIKSINALQFIIDEASNKLNAVRDSQTKVIWFGYTVYIDIIQKALISRGQRIHYVIDNDSNKWGNILEDDLIIFPVEQIAKKYGKNAVFLISSRFEAEMVQQLHKLDVNPEHIIQLPSKEKSAEMAHNALLERITGLRKIEPREIQMILLDILKVFANFCEANKLRYFLAGGTLLGAIRHKGFIPWDDDLDVYLPDVDYERFMETFPVGGRYEAWDWRKYPDYISDFGKLSNNNTVVVHGGYPVNRIQPISICVIPLHGYPDDKEAFYRKRKTNINLDLKWYWYQNAREVVLSELQDLRNDIYELKNNNSFDSSPITANTHLQFIETWNVPRRIFEKTVMVDFEGEKFCAPQGWDYYLTHRFGDYMTLPPVSERINHGLISFWK